MMITRRDALSAAAFALVGGSSLAARADTTSMVVGTWGGDYGAMLQQNVDIPVFKPLGIEVSQEIANDDTRVTKLIAERGTRRGSMDVACLSDLQTYNLAQMGVLETIEEGAVPRLSQVLPVFKSPDGIPHNYSALVVLYNPNKISVPPTSLAALFDSKYKGRLGYSDILYYYNIAAASLAAGGTMTDFSKGRAALMDQKKLGVKVYPSNEALATALKSEEIWLTAMWIARGFMWKSSGIPIEMAYPEEGAIPVLFHACVPKNSRAKASAFKYLNAMLEPATQTAFAAKMGYLPTVKDAKLPENLARQISLTEAQEAKLHPVDYAYTLEQRTAILDFWNKDFKG